MLLLRDLMAYIEAGYVKKKKNTQQCYKKRALAVEPGRFSLFFFVNGDNMTLVPFTTNSFHQFSSPPTRSHES